MSVQDCVEERLLLYMGMAYNGYGLWTWYFGEKGTLYYTNCPAAEELQAFFYLGGCLDYALTLKNNAPAPFLMSDSLGLIWLGEYIVHPGQELRFFVVGPAFQSRVSVFGLGDALQNMHFSPELQHSYMNLLMKMPVVNLQQFKCLARMLHYTIGFSDMQGMEIKYQVTERSTPERPDFSETIDYEQANHREKILLQYVSDGNPNFGDVLDVFNDYDMYGLKENSPARLVKNRMLIFTSHCAAAAMESGVPLLEAKAMEADYIRMIEQQITATSLIQLCKRMLGDFISQVEAHRESTLLSKPVQQCCAYVKKHMTETISLKVLADYTGYSEYYLARRFQREMGIKLLDYIKQVRLDYAKILLSTTNLTVQVISEKLQFGSRNYFTKKFKEYTGLSPAEFRQSAWGNKGGADE